MVGSTNPAKLRAVQAVFGLALPELTVRGMAIPSGVPDQPVGFAQTRRGALGRARGALAEPGAAWGVGLEGGVRFGGGAAWLFGVAAVGRPGCGLSTARSAELRLPPQVAARLRAGEELGPVMDALLGTVDIKRGVGTVGALSGGLVTRSEVWFQALALALAPLLSPGVYAPAAGAQPDRDARVDWDTRLDP